MAMNIRPSIRTCRAICAAPRRLAAVALLCGATAAPNAASATMQLQSPALAAELQAVLAQKQLEAIAVQDPAAPDRVIAVLAFPGVQLLVVSARPRSVEYAKWQIGQQQYRQVYESLQQTGLAEHRLFFQDLGADGLPATTDDGVDVMYEGGSQTLFDNAVKRKGRDAEEFRKRLLEADAQYSRILRLAIAAAKQHGESPGR